ncbi:MAG: acyl--CoA ligase [Clostridiales bacterium]|nr:acyl--CoA ligase [Clostridiales bacterium]
MEYAVGLTGSKFAFCFDVSEKSFDGMDLTLVKCRTNTYFEKTPVGYVRSIGYKQKIKGRTGEAHVNRKIDWSDFIRQGEDYVAENGPLAMAGEPEDTAAIMFTGGTTGLPKGVMLSNRAINNLSYIIYPELEKVNFNPETDGMMTALPVFHGFGFAICMHTSFLAQIPQALFPSFDAKACSASIKKHRLAFIFGVPDFFQKVLKAGYLDKADLSNVKIIATGGDTVPHQLTVSFDKLLASRGAKAHLSNGYGLTECVTVCTLSDIHKPSKQGCIGVPIKDVLAKTVEVGTTREVKGKDGELCIYAPTLMQGYYNDPEETAKVLVRHDDGRVWLHTGDMCFIDENGDIYFRQRLKRVLKISGYLVYPSFIEETMRSMKEIYDCCVIGVENGSRTELKLYVVKHKRYFSMDEAEMTEKIMKFASDNLSKWSVPKSIEYIEALPRTKVGKVDFKVLQAQNEPAQPAQADEKQAV